MTPEQREQAFLEDMKAAADRHGVRVEAVSIAEQLGPVIQVRSQIVVTALPDWTPPIAQPANGKVKEPA
jgi:hypothetical protein